VDAADQRAAGRSAQHPLTHTHGQSVLTPPTIKYKAGLWKRRRRRVLHVMVKRQQNPNPCG
jgi:hypothetical protein